MTPRNPMQTAESPIQFATAQTNSHNTVFSSEVQYCL